MATKEYEVIAAKIPSPLDGARIAQLDSAAANIIQGLSQDVERGHLIADGVLLDLLRNLGCDKTVVAFGKLPKWYS